MLWIRIRIDFGRLDLDPESALGMRSRTGPEGQKRTHKNRKKGMKFHVFEVLDVIF